MSYVEVDTGRHGTPMLLWCPECHERHVDEGEFATKDHHTHACQHCGHVWRPAILPTYGVRFLPGYGPETLLTEIEEAKHRLVAVSESKRKILKVAHGLLDRLAEHETATVIADWRADLERM